MKTILGSILFLLASSVCIGQSDPVQWTIEAEKVSETEYEVSFTANIDHGWSIYSPEVPKELGPVPTTFEFSPESGVKLLGDAQEAGQKKEDFDQMFGATLTKYLNKARFSQRIKVDRDTTTIKGLLTYMSCDATSCLPPADLSFEIDLGE